MRAVVAGIALALLAVLPVAAGRPAFSLSLDESGLHHGDLAHVSVAWDGANVYHGGTYWVRIDCTDGSAFFLEDLPIAWDGGRHDWTSTVGPFQLGSGLVVNAPGSAGTTVGDWFSGAGDCRAFVWQHDGFSLDNIYNLRVSPFVTFHVEA